MDKNICNHESQIYKDGYYICEICGYMISESEMIELIHKKYPSHDVKGTN
jgi:hypothetical protein